MKQYTYPLYDVNNHKNPIEHQKDFYDFIIKHSEEMSVLHTGNEPEYKGSPIFDIVNQHINDNSILRPICAEVLDLLNEDMILVLCGRLQEYSNVIQHIEFNEQALIFLSFLKKVYAPVIDEYETVLNKEEAFPLLISKLSLLESKYPELSIKISTVFELYEEIDISTYDVLIGLISKDLEAEQTIFNF